MSHATVGKKEKAKVPPAAGATGMGADASAKGNMSNHKKGPAGKPHAGKSESQFKIDRVPPSSSNSNM